MRSWVASAAALRVVIEYEREAFVSPNEEYARVSFDRGIAAFPTHEWSFDGGRKHLRKMPMSLDPRATSFVLVELKCETMIPSFMAELIRHFELNRVGYSKYKAAMLSELALLNVRDPHLADLLDA